LPPFCHGFHSGYSDVFVVKMPRTGTVIPAKGRMLVVGLKKALSVGMT